MTKQPSPSIANVQGADAQIAYQEGYAAAQENLQQVLQDHGQEMLDAIQGTQNVVGKAADDLLSTINPLMGRRYVATNPMFGYGWMEEVSADAFRADATGTYKQNSLFHRASRLFADGLDKLHNGFFRVVPGGEYLYERLYGVPMQDDGMVYNRPNLAGGEANKTSGITYGHRNALVSLGFMWMGLVDDVVNHWTRNILGMKGFWRELTQEGRWREPIFILKSINPFKHIWNEAKWLGWDLVRNVIADAEVGLLYVYIKEKGLEKKNAKETTLAEDGRPVVVETAEAARDFYVMPFILYNVYVYGVHNSWADLLGDALGISDQSDVLRYMRDNGMNEKDLGFLQKSLNRAIDFTGYTGQRLIEIFSTMKVPAEMFSPLRYFSLQEVNKAKEERAVVQDEIKLLQITRHLPDAAAQDAQVQRELQELRALHAQENKLTFLNQQSRLELDSFSGLLHRFYVARDTLRQNYDVKPETERQQEATAYLAAKDAMMDKMFRHILDVAAASGMTPPQREALIQYLRDGENNYLDYLKSPTMKLARKIQDKPVPTIDCCHFMEGADRMTLEQLAKVRPETAVVIDYARTLMGLYHKETSRTMYEQKEYDGLNSMARHWVSAHFDMFDHVSAFDNDKDARRKDYGVNDGTHVGTVRFNPHGPSKAQNFRHMALQMKEQAISGALDGRADWQSVYEQSARGLQRVQQYAADFGAYGLYIGAKRASNTLVRGTPGLNGHWFGHLVSKLKAGEPVEKVQKHEDVERQLTHPLMQYMQQEGAKAQQQPHSLPEARSEIAGAASYEAQRSNMQRTGAKADAYLGHTAGHAGQTTPPVAGLMH